MRIRDLLLGMGLALAGAALWPVYEVWRTEVRLLGMLRGQELQKGIMANAAIVQEPLTSDFFRES